MTSVQRVHHQSPPALLTKDVDNIVIETSASEETASSEQSESSIDAKLTSSASTNNNNNIKGPRTWKKPVGKPKRPLSAYNMFFQLERDRIVAGASLDEMVSFTPEQVANVRIVPAHEMPKRKDRKTHGKIAFADLARVIGTKWKQLDSTSKKLFEDRAKIEKDRYEYELMLWKAAQSQQQQQQQISSMTIVADGASQVPSCIVADGTLPKDELEEYFAQQQHKHLRMEYIGRVENNGMPSYDDAIAEDYEYDAVANGFYAQPVANYMNHLGDVDYEDIYNEGAAYEQPGQHIVTPSRGVNGTLRKPINAFQPTVRVRSGSVSSVTRHVYQEAMKTYNWAQRHIGSVATRRISMDNSSIGDRSAKRSISSPTSVTAPPSPPPTQSSTSASLAPISMTHDEQASVGGHHNGTGGAIRRVSVGHASTTSSSQNLAALAGGQKGEGHGQQLPRRRSMTSHRNSSWPNPTNQQHMLSRNAHSAVDMASMAVAKLQQQQLLHRRQTQIRLARRNAVALRQHHHHQLLALEMEANRMYEMEDIMHNEQHVDDPFYFSNEEDGPSSSFHDDDLDLSTDMQHSSTYDLATQIHQQISSSFFPADDDTENNYDTINDDGIDYEYGIF